MVDTVLHGCRLHTHPIPTHLSTYKRTRQLHTIPCSRSSRIKAIEGKGEHLWIDHAQDVLPHRRQTPRRDLRDTHHVVMPLSNSAIHCVAEQRQAPFILIRDESPKLFSFLVAETLVKHIETLKMLGDFPITIMQMDDPDRRYAHVPCGTFHLKKRSRAGKNRRGVFLLSDKEIDEPSFRRRGQYRLVPFIKSTGDDSVDISGMGEPHSKTPIPCPNVMLARKIGLNVLEIGVFLPPSKKQFANLLRSDG